MDKYLSFCSRSWTIFPERSGTYTSGAGRSSSPQLSIGKEKRAASDARLLPTSSFDRALCFLSLAMLTPHAFIHLIQEYTGMSHLFRLVLLKLYNLLRVRISFQGIPRSAFIANPSSTGICTWRGFDCKSSCCLSSSPRMPTSSWSCCMCAPPLTTCRTLPICSLLR